METVPNFTMYFKVGVVGMSDEIVQTVTLALDPNLSPEEILQRFTQRCQAAQLRLQADMTELMSEKFPAFMDAEAKANGWDLGKNSGMFG